MRIGVPKEIKSNENRVGIVPAGVHALTADGHRVMVETTAGLGSGISDQEFKDAGAEIVPTAKDLWAKAEMVMKVKEPLPAEYPLCRPDLTVFTYFHFAADRELTDAMINSGAAAVAYETLADDQGRYLDANPAACGLLGRTRDQVLASTMYDVMAS